MLSRTFCLLVFTAVIMSSAAFAQITIQASGIDGPGHSFLQVEASAVTVSTGSGGANQTWTIPAYTWDDSSSYDVVDPAATVFAAHFPTATRAQHSMESDQGMTFHVYMFERVAADGLFLLGLGYQMDTLTVPMPFDPEFRQAPLPLSYGMTWTNVQSSDLGGGETEIDSSILTVDGWGTLNTPYGSFQVLRIFIHAWETTTGPNGTFTSEDASFSFVDARGISWANLESNEESGNPNFTNGRVRLLQETSGSAVEPVRGPVAAQFTVGQNYPNPFNPNTVLPLELAHTAQVTLDVYDQTGRLVATESFELPAGQHTLPVDGSGWATGTYFARVSAHGVQQTMKMQLVK